MTDVATNIVPSSVGYSDTDVERLSWTPVLRDGMFKVAVTKAFQGADEETKNLCLNLTFAPLDVTDTPQNTAVRKAIYIPLANPAVSGHTVVEFSDDPKKSIKKRFESFVKAIDPSAFKGLPQLRRDEETGTWYNGAEVMTKDMWAVYNKQKNKIICEKAKEWYNNTAALVGAVTYAFVARSETGQYANIVYLTENPGDKPVITDRFTG